MPNKTANYNLIKPLGSEHYDINVHNGNMDIIDEELKKVTESNNKRIDEIKSELNDSSLEVFKTDFLSIKLDGCSGGFVNIDSIQGRTLVNLFSEKATTVTRTEPEFAFSVDYILNRVVGENTYTFVNFTNKKVTLPSYNGTTWDVSYECKENGITVINLPSGKELHRIDFYINQGWQKTDISNFSKINFMLLEGDWTNKPIPSYFEGIQSVGEPVAIGNNIYDDTKAFSVNSGGGTFNTNTNSLTLNRTDVTSYVIKQYYNLKPNTTYEFQANTLDNISVHIYRMENTVSGNFQGGVSKISGNVCYITTDNTGLIGIYYIALAMGKCNITGISLRECDYRIEILSKGKNLLDINNSEKYSNSSNYSSNNNYTFITTGNTRSNMSGALKYNGAFLSIPIEYNGSNYFTVANSGFYDFIYGLNGDVMDGKLKNTIYLKANIPYIFTANVVASSANSLTINSAMLEQNTVKTTYEPYKRDKIEILTTQPLRKINDSIYDSVNNSGIITRNCGQVVLNGSEEWSTYDIQKPNTLLFKYSNMTIKSIIEMDGNCLPYQFPSKHIIYKDEEGIVIGNNNSNLFIRVNKSRLDTQDIAGFKTWLSQNPITVVYQLSTPTTENTNKTLDLKAYDNLIVNAGSIQPEVTYSYSKNTGERFVTIEDTVNGVKGTVEDINKNFEEKIKEINIKTSNIKVPVTKVNGKDGDIVLSASDIKNSEGKTLEMKAIELNNLQNTLNAVNSTLNSLKSTIDSINNKVSTMQNTIWIGQ